MSARTWGSLSRTSFGTRSLSHRLDDLSHHLRTKTRPSNTRPSGQAVFWSKRWHSTAASTSDPIPPLSSVSQEEVSHFSSLASSWWDPHGPSRLLHLMNPLRHDFIQSCLQSVPSQASSPTTTTAQQHQDKRSYLDIGCGGGIFASSAARLLNTSSVTGIDPTSHVIQIAKSQQRTDPALAEPKLKYVNTAIEDLPLPKTDAEKIDIISVFEVLEHIDLPSVFLDTCIPHLRTGGWIIGSTIARHPISFITTKLVAEAPIVGVVPRGTHDWNKYINPGELEEYFSRKAPGKWGPFRVQGVLYVPGLGWKEVDGSEKVGNYFFGVQKLE